MSTQDFAAIQARARRPEDVVRVCLAGDLVAEHEALEQRLAELKDDPNAGVEGNGSAELAEQIQALEERMKADTYPIRLRALKRPAFKALVAAHPPRRTDEGEVDERDKGRGFNIDSLYEVLVPLSIVDPQLDEPAMRRLVDEDLTDGQFIELGNLAFFLNRGTVDVPFSRAASAILRNTGGE
jgi:hypothetical protein